MPATADNMKPIVQDLRTLLTRATRPRILFACLSRVVVSTSLPLCHSRKYPLNPSCEKELYVDFIDGHSLVEVFLEVLLLIGVHISLFRVVSLRALQLDLLPNSV